MNKSRLDQKLEEWVDELPKESKRALLADLDLLKSVYPFNEYEYRMMFLLDRKIITFQEYHDLRDAYVGANQNLNLYSIGPRVFGQVWAEQHLIQIDARFKKPSKQTDKCYTGGYDLYVEDQPEIIRIEVKASRAVDTHSRGPLETKALYFESDAPYWMNFQQIKVGVADAFVFVGVWIDKTLYWVLTNEEIEKHPKLSHQHRGGVEYQIGITKKNIDAFQEHLAEPGELVSIIKMKTKKLGDGN